MTKQDLELNKTIDNQEAICKPISFEEYNKRMGSLKTMGDVTSFVKDLISPTLQAMLGAQS